MTLAWEDFEGANGAGWSGDKPIDEFALALGRIAVAYEQEFDRKPTGDIPRGGRKVRW